MRHVFTMFLLIALALGCAAAYALTVTIAPDRMLEVDGERIFVIGLYENPADDAVLDEVAGAGFKLVRSGADTAALDRLHARDLWAWIVTGYNIDLSENRAAREDALENMVEAFAGHPALLVWEVPDEALWNCYYLAIQWRRHQEPAQLHERIDALDDEDLVEELREMRQCSNDLWREGLYAEAEAIADDMWRKLGEDPPRPGYGLGDAPQRAAKMQAGMVEGYTLLRELDPKHPVWMNHAPRNQIAQLAAFNRAADIVGCDIYPVREFETGHSDIAERTLAAVGAYTIRMQAAAPAKPVWMVLQGFGWHDLFPDQDPEKGRRPTLEETRFMAYDAIVNGARGILYWGTHMVEKDSQFWEDLLTVVAELDALKPVLAAPDAPGAYPVSFAETFGSVDRGIRVLPKTFEDKTWFLVVNEWTDPLTYTIRGLDGLDGMRYTERYTENEVMVANRSLTLTIPAQRVHVLIPE